MLMLIMAMMMLMEAVVEARGLQSSELHMDVRPPRRCTASVEILDPKQEGGSLQSPLLSWHRPGRFSVMQRRFSSCPKAHLNDVAMPEPRRM